MNIKYSAFTKSVCPSNAVMHSLESTCFLLPIFCNFLQLCRNSTPTIEESHHNFISWLVEELSGRKKKKKPFWPVDVFPTFVSTPTCSISLKVQPKTRSDERDGGRDFILMQRGTAKCERWREEERVFGMPVDLLFNRIPCFYGCKDWALILDPLKHTYIQYILQLQNSDLNVCLLDSVWRF